MKSLLFFASVTATAALAQTLPPVKLEITTDHLGPYGFDSADATKYGIEANPTTRATARNFLPSIALADIIDVNGTPARGVAVFRQVSLIQSPTPAPGQAISDLARGSIVYTVFELADQTGRSTGSLICLGLSGGELSVVGGTGAFYGVRGIQTTNTVVRPANRPPGPVLEDPANRRQHGGGSFRYTFFLDPGFRPSILTTDSGIAVAHSSDSSLVTASRPAQPGELLTLIATGLGPARAPVEPGLPFPSSPLAVVNSPVLVMAGGAPCEVLYAGGHPGTTDRYQVNFRLPQGLPSGTVNIHLVAGHIPGPAIALPVR